MPLQRARHQVSHWRRRAGATVTRGFFEGIARAGRMLPQADPRRHDVEVIRDVAYLPGGAVHHTLDVYRPIDRSGPLPVMFYVHGGAFCILSKDTHWVMGLAFARRGFVVFNINYRLAPQHPFPAGLEDTCRALTWVLDNAHRYGGDATRLAFAGESAGANLITGLTIASRWRRPEPWARAVFDADPAVRAVIPACGILQVTDPERITRRKKLSPFVADRVTEVQQMYLPRVRPPGLDLALADPLVFLERAGPPDRALPAFLAFVGTRDPLLDDTRRLSAALDRLGVTCETRYYPGGFHAFHALVFDPLARSCWRDQYAFLSRHF